MNADALAYLASKGLSIDEIIEFARLSERKADPTNAARQARYRERQRNTVTVTPVTNEEGKNPPQTPHKNSYTPVTPKGVTAPKGAVRNRGSRIDPDWKPPAVSDLPAEAKALAEQWTDASYKTEAAAFVDFWTAETGARAAKADWRRAWYNRIVQIHSKVMRDQKFGNAAPEPEKPVKIDAITLDRRAALFRRMGRDEDAADCERRAARLRQGGSTAPIGSFLAHLTGQSP